MKNSIQTYVFKPNSKAEFLEERFNLIGWIILLSSILFLILEFYLVAIVVMVSLSMVCYTMAFFRWNRLEKPKGSFPIDLVFYDDRITLGGMDYKLENIKVKKLICYDYVGRPDTGFVFHAKYPKKSCGTWNHFWFESYGKAYQLRFRISNEIDSCRLTAIKEKWKL
ncbi:hypothetical protein ACFOUP_05065 [Belliella kenyensis]|uniref:Uncharacterized protein n=1 Tax=Belliella kenyensis TaxID=1472724 RepID=A0ABV8EHF8_9BACT|nr:hypothetical protein [Belliella kenyensis]MCH7402664.1 hypothetical protein [Belliella kenyensis]MDN3603788.1 hypothetical protein [Belliella kenyensis]